MNIKLKERKVVVLKDLEILSTFKIEGSSFVFMKIDVDGLTVLPKRKEETTEEPKPIKVLIPEGMTPVICLNSGKAQFLKLDEKVRIVVLDCEELFE